MQNADCVMTGQFQEDTIVTTAANSQRENEFKPLPPGKKYHVFLSYRDVDEDNQWVCELIDILERDHKLKCCNHASDFQPGMTIVENIKNAVFSSVKTLIVMSKHYKDSYWCKFEVEFSHKLSMDVKQNLIIPVLKETCEIPDHLLAFTYVDARGQREEWIPRLVAAVLEEGAWNTRSHFPVPERNFGYQNLDIIHEEKSKLGWCCKKLPFKTRERIPYALNNRVVNVSDDAYFKILHDISKAVYFRCRHCIFPWTPSVLCAFALLSANVLVFFIFLGLSLNVDQNRRPTEASIDWTATEVLGCVLFCLLWWPASCFICYKKRKTFFVKTLIEANTTTMINNILVGYRLYYTSATIGVVYVYFDAHYCKEYIKTHLRETEKCSVSIDIHTCNATGGTEDFTINQTENYREDDRLICSQRLHDRQYDNIKDFDAKAWNMLFHLSADYIQDFLDEKLGHSERFRHTPQAMCMCEYAQFKNMIPNDIS